MERQIAILIFFIVLIFFTLIAYYGARITLWSSIVLSVLISLIIMNIFYPPSNLPMDVADYTLIIYALIEIIGILIIIIYIIQHTLCDERGEHECVI
jgi:tellurite resistance protein TehA-like permease